MRESYPAAIARLKSVADTYPLYSGADEALFELGGAYEKEIEFIRRSRLPETVKGKLIKQYSDGAVAAYDRILTRYPLEDRAGDARKRLEAMKQTVPKATPQEVAQDKAEIDSRGSLGHIGKVMENFHRGPDVSEAAKVGEPTLVDPQQASAPDMVRAANNSLADVLAGAGVGNHVSVERLNDGSTASRERAGSTFGCCAGHKRSGRGPGGSGCGCQWRSQQWNANRACRQRDEERFGSCRWRHAGFASATDAGKRSGECKRQQRLVAGSGVQQFGAAASDSG